MTNKNRSVTKFTRTNVRDILEECRAALEPIAEKHGLVLDRKGRTYYADALPVMFQLLVKQTDENGRVLSAEGKAFLEQATLFGLKPEDLGRKFQDSGDEYEVCGLKPRSRKYPVLATNTRSGKTFKFPVSVVRAALESKAA